MTIIVQYTPTLNEPVVGVVTARFQEGFRVDIGTSQSANLDSLAFEGSTKRDRPSLKANHCFMIYCDNDGKGV
jgi:exosome complex component RRP40